MTPELEMPQEAFMLDVLTAAAQPASPASGATRLPLTELVPVAALITSDTPRVAGEDAEHVDLLAQTEKPLPPVVVHRPSMRLIDGLHRLRAAIQRGEDHIEVRYVEGSSEDAFVLAVQLNAEHGMPLSRRDRRAAAERIIGSHAGWSDRRIAEVTGLAPTTVATLRKRSTGQGDQLNVRTGRDGRTRPVNSAVGRQRAGQIIAERPNASLREIAHEAGIALATARDVRLRVRNGKDPVPPKLREVAKDAVLRDRRTVRGRVETDTAERGGRARLESAGVSDVDRFSNLRKDPSLRFSEAGRTLLQLLSSNVLDDEKWRWLMSAVPEHRHADIARAARRCGERWLTFADGLEHSGGVRNGRAM
ncbi:ParB/RepB/Spo0J family partition protein [Streptomyces flavofungini]|uniref:ParB/RepB/Spo0J family partition protein n=1 Tax=Streptomyces flavofungini TaxID=68200 RepID=UPI0034DFC443